MVDRCGPVSGHRHSRWAAPALAFAPWRLVRAPGDGKAGRSVDDDGHLCLHK